VNILPVHLRCTKVNNQPIEGGCSNFISVGEIVRVFRYSPTDGKYSMGQKRDCFLK